MFRGFGDRFQAELKELVPKTIKVKVTAERNRKYASWVGGTMYAGLNDYKMILKRDYDEVGSRLITKIFPWEMNVLFLDCFCMRIYFALFIIIIIHYYIIIYLLINKMKLALINKLVCINESYFIFQEKKEKEKKKMIRKCFSKV